MPRFYRILGYCFRQWPLFVGILVLTVAYSATAAVQPWPMKILVDYGLSATAAPGTLENLLGQLSLEATPATLVIVAAVASLGLFALNSCFDVLLNWSWTLAGQRMVYNLAGDLFDRLQRLSLIFHSRRSVGDLLSRLTGDTYCVYTVTQGLVLTPLQKILTIAAVGAVAWQLDRQLTLLTFAVAPVLAVSAFVFGPLLKKRAKRNREARSRVMSFVHQTLTAVPVVQAFGRERHNLDNYRNLAEDAVLRARQGAIVRSAHGLVDGLGTTIGSAVVLYMGSWRVMSGAMTIGSLLVFLAYMRKLRGEFTGLFGTYASLKSAEASVDRVLEVMDSDECVREPPHAKRLPSETRHAQGHVCIENVTFGYETDRPVLHEVSLEARPGEKVALVGATGGGKSTLVSLIPRFFDPWQGRITLDGYDLRDLKIASLRSQFALVLQEPFLLPLTVAENIAYGRPHATFDEIIAAAKTANADDFIRRLPRGYETVIGERGATLSGGEKQRLAIARALLKDAAVLILDEPTSALDAQTEASLLEALERLMVGRTAFIIAHRLSTIRQANRIYVLDHGRLIETGTHEQLLATNGAYRQFHELQFGGARQEAVA